MNISLQRLLYICALLVFLAAMVFSVFYYTSGSDQLASWFYSLNDCFYRKDNWRNDFFTPHVKEVGDRLCMLAFVVSIIGGTYIVRRWKYATDQWTMGIKWSRSSTLYACGLIAVGLSAGIYSWLYLPPAYDEIFSAENIASLHPFQTLSYYMLPNNHIFFNLLNNLLFFPFSDKVATGRLLSLISYLAVLVISFRWLITVTKNHVAALIIAALLAVQLPAWGFSAQARGYEMELLTGWMSFVTWYRYWRGKSDWLAIHCLANIVGYALLPSYLSFHVALVLFSALHQLSAKRWDWKFWKYQLLTGLFVFLFYLPALCFSGFSAFTDTIHVAPSAASLAEFMPIFKGDLREIIHFGFTNFMTEYAYVNYTLFTLPILLFLSKNRVGRMLAICHFTLWLVMAVLALKMRHMPFPRNLIIQYSISLAIIVYTMWTGIEYCISRTRLLRYSPLVLFALISPLLYHFTKDFNGMANYTMYQNNVNVLHNWKLGSVITLPKGNAVAFSEESFYWLYTCRKLGYDVAKCPRGNEAYFVKRKGESLPPAFQRYLLLSSHPDDYEVYQRP